MKEPVHFGTSHEGLEVYSGGEHVGTFPFDQVPYLLVTLANLLTERPDRWMEKPAPPVSLRALFEMALREETATHAPRRTTAIEALTQGLRQLEGR